MSSDLKHNEDNFLPQWLKKFQIPNWKRLAFALSSIKPIDCIAHRSTFQICNEIRKLHFFYVKMDTTDMITEERMDYDYVVTTEWHRSESEETALFFVFAAIFVSLLILVQFVMRVWRGMSPHSFKVTTTYAICLVPLALAYFFSWKWFLFWWIIFAAVSTIAYLKAKEKPINRSTPGRIYKWFILVHNVTFLITSIGFATYWIGLLGCIFAGSACAWLVDMGTMLFFYGVYFGLVGRDVAMHITETIALGPGFYTPESKFLLPTLAIHHPHGHTNTSLSICCLCSHSLNGNESTCTISCNHMFHERCLRGWCMVGKKTTCPVCREKVDFHLPDRNPWEVPDSFLQGYHDFLHWAVVYFPILIAMLALSDMLLKKIL